MTIANYIVIIIYFIIVVKLDLSIAIIRHVERNEKQC